MNIIFNIIIYRKIKVYNKKTHRVTIKAKFKLNGCILQLIIVLLILLDSYQNLLFVNLQFYKKSCKTCLLLFFLFVAYTGSIINVVIINIMNVFIFFKCFWSLE